MNWIIISSLVLLEDFIFIIASDSQTSLGDSFFLEEVFLYTHMIEMKLRPERINILSKFVLLVRSRARTNLYLS